MDETKQPGDDDYVESSVESEAELVKSWTFRKRKRATTETTPATGWQSSFTEKPASKTRKRNSSRSSSSDPHEIPLTQKALPSSSESSEDERQRSIVEGAIGDQGYVEFYNAAISDFVSGEYATPSITPPLLQAEDDATTKIIETISLGWTTAAIDKFFQSLQQCHHINYAHTAQVTGKTEEEVRSHVQRLERKVKEYAIFEDFETDLALPEEFPIAFEISSSGVKLLDILAQRLCSRELAYEKWHAQRKLGRYAILDHTAANQLSQMETLLELRRIPKTTAASESHEDALVAGTRPLGYETFIRHHEPLIEAAQLLRPRVFLELSEQLFMNPSPPRMDENWRSLTDGQERPSMMRTFFIDMYTLALRITKKLVASTLFQASARLSTHEDGSDEITAYDVENAAHVIGLKTDWKTYWAGVARRCNVQVFDELPVPPTYTSKATKTDVVWLSYEELEAALGQETEPTSNVASRQSTSESDNEQEPPSLPFDDDEDPDADYDSYLEAHDMSASRHHELNLWASLDRTAPMHLFRQVRVRDPPRLHQLGEHVHPNRLRDMLERASDFKRVALENSALRRRRRSSSAAPSEPPLDTHEAANLLPSKQDMNQAGTPRRGSTVSDEGTQAAVVSDDEELVEEDEQATTTATNSQSNDETEDQAGPSVTSQIAAERRVNSEEESDEEPQPQPQPKAKPWKGKGRAVPFPTTISRIEDLVYSSDNNSRTE